YWPEAKNGFLISVAGWVLSGIGSFVLIGTVATAAMAEFDDFEIPQELRQPDFESSPAETLEIEPESQMDLTPLSPTPLPTLPPPTPPPVDAGDATEQEAGPDDRIGYDELDEYVGRLLEIRLTDGSHSRVRLESVAPEGLRVNQRLGGGSMSYSIKRDSIKEIRLP
ncbi:MAG: hypothetical protein ACYS7M_13960, partial [Planctomycetota bacterium]